MAAMSVIGIDFGNESCYVAVAKAGGIETIANDYSLRGTPSCVAFALKNRILGVAAKNQMVTNMKNTVVGFKRLLGRRFLDVQAQKELRSASFRSEQRSDGGIGIRVNYLGEEHVFTPEQITAMLFTKLKDTSATALQTQVNDCVITVPSYFTNSERKALLDAASIAGLNVLRLMNETTATALAYGIYKQDLPALEEKPRNVIFVDCGHSSLQVAACAFHRGKLKILASAADGNCGGRDIDYALAEHFCKDFQTRYKVNTKGNQRAYLRLLQEVEKVKKQMSANSTRLPLNIECFIDEKDVTGDMQRGDMEQLCSDIFHRVDRCLKSCLAKSKLHLDEIHSVEIVGGSSRTPAIKGLIEKVFGKTPSTTLNQDEAVARGAALQCAILSPAVRVRDFSVTDIQPYSVRLSWDAALGEDGDMEVFPANHPAPFSKMLSFYRREPFTVRAYYSDDEPFENSLIGQWVIKDIQPSADGESQKVKLKVRVNIHGIVTVASASLVEKRDASEQENGSSLEAMDGVEGGEGGETNPTPHGAADQNGTAADEGEDDPDKKDKSKNKKQVAKTIELPIEARTHGFSTQDLNNYLELEGKMQAADRQEKERADARNALEEYVYELRGRIAEGESLHSFIAGPERDALQSRLDGLENWLYEEGEDCNRQTYQDKLTELRTDGEPIKARRLEWELRPGSLEDFAHVIQLATKFINLYEAGDAKYAHLSEADVGRVREALENAQSWLDKARGALGSAPPHLPPPYTVHQIRQEKQSFEGIVNPIVNKLKPKEKSPPPATNSNQHGEPNPATEQNSEQPGGPQVEQMDVE